MLIARPMKGAHSSGPSIAWIPATWRHGDMDVFTPTSEE